MTLASSPRHPQPGARFAAVILAGGKGARLGGRDKASLEIAGDCLLARVQAAVRDAEELVVVGPTRPDATWSQVQESPAGSGPMAAISTGVAALTGTAEFVLVTAVDMPHLRATTVHRLLANAGPDGAVLVDPNGRRVLTLVLRLSALRQLLGNLENGLANAPVWRTLAGLDLTEIPAEQREHEDIDTPTDLARAQVVAAPIR